MKTIAIDIAVLSVAGVLTVVGFVGAIVAWLVADSGWHGIAIGDAWPVILLLVWGGVAGVAVCRQSRQANRLLILWWVACSAWMTLASLQSADDDGQLAAAVSATLLALVAFLALAPRSNGDAG